MTIVYARPLCYTQKSSILSEIPLTATAHIAKLFTPPLRLFRMAPSGYDPSVYDPNESSESKARPRRKWRLPLIVIAVCVVLGVIGWFIAFEIKKHQHHEMTYDPSNPCQGLKNCVNPGVVPYTSTEPHALPKTETAQNTEHTAVPFTPLEPCPCDEPPEGPEEGKGV